MGIEYIKNKKIELGITTSELSKLSGVPVGTLNKILSGETIDPKYETVKAICSALNISILELDGAESCMDQEALSIAEDIKNRPELLDIFKDLKNIKGDDLQIIATITNRLKK